MAFAAACQQALAARMIRVPGHDSRDWQCHMGVSGCLPPRQLLTTSFTLSLAAFQRGFQQRGYSKTPVTAAAANAEALAEDTSLQPRMVQWYPGHIAKAERDLKEQLGSVDLVIEVRDARIPLATSHPQLPGWVGNKPLLLVLNRVDMVSAADQATWTSYFRARGQPVLWTDAKVGTGVKKVTKAAVTAGGSINEARKRRGLRPRPLKAAVVGFPNVGKSALINRLLGRKLAPSAPRPGVTRQLRWLRLGGEVDLLDTPGVLPMSLRNQAVAQRLAVCNDIGEASYVASLVAAAMVDSVLQLPTGDAIGEAFVHRYRLSPDGLSGESYVAKVAEALFQGDEDRAGQRLLKDYRLGNLGTFAIERPPRQQY